jgi:hypothetical protein
VTGNGLDDIVGFGADGVYVALANGNGTFQQPVLALPNEFGALSSAGGWTSQNEYPRLLGDVTGNGMADIVGFGQAGVFVALANGGASSGAKQSAKAASGDGPIISGMQTIDSGAAIDSPTIDGGTLSLSTGAIVSGPITFAAGGTGTLFDADGLNDTVVGFSEGRTFLSFNGETPASEAQVIASATSASGNTILSFPDHTSVVLLGVTHPDIGIFG